MRRLTNGEYSRKIKESWGSQFILLSEYEAMSKVITVLHADCGTTYTSNAQYLLNKGVCPTCSKRKRITHTEFYRLFKKIYGDDYLMKSKYINSKTKVKVKHVRCGRVYEVSPYYLKKGSKCLECTFIDVGKSHRMTHEQFMNKVTQRHGNEIEVLSEYITSAGKLNYRHIPCGRVYTSTPDNLLNSRGCKPCSMKRFAERTRKTMDEFRIEVERRYPGDFEILSGYRGSKVNIEVKQISCGHVFSVTPSNLLGGSGCPQCNVSRGERKISQVLDSLGVEYYMEWKIGGRRGSTPRFDFYIPSKKAYIEYDGRQHFEAIERWGGEDGLRGVQSRDRIKNIYCEKIGCPLLRIPHWDFHKIDTIVTQFIATVDDIKGGVYDYQQQ